jgi:hypothetical protein
MERMNCWQVMKCGREPGGARVEACGPCPAALPDEIDGVNRGSHGGRFCWAIAGTLGGGKVQGTYPWKIRACLRCKFLKLVDVEEGKEFILAPQRAIALREYEDERQRRNNAPEPVPPGDGESA